MATNAFNSIYHHQRHHSLRRRRSLDCPLSAAKTPFFLPPTPASSSLSFAATSATSSALTSTTNPSTSQNTSLDLLRQHLSAKDFRQADEETRRLLIALAGDAAQKRGYVFFSEVQFISGEELKAIDELWKLHSDGRFGYSVQKKIWKKAKKDFTKFFVKVGWMKKLESSEVEQYNYRAFPAEFMWEMEEATPEGHLPLTNALRGTQLLTNILNHPAFEDENGEDEDKEVDEKDRIFNAGIKPLSNKTTFKTNYTF